MLKYVAIAILLLPLAEIAAFVLLAAWIGVGPALLCLIGSSLAGMLVLRSAGRGGLSRFRGGLADPAGLEAHTGGFFDVLAGLLLFLPGLLTGLAGTLLLLGPLRRFFHQRFIAWLGRRPSDPGTVDLEPDQWERLPDRELPHDSKRHG